ncbi:hypothetical protein EJ06DRAFT_583701 [Trichodelitschia bisporula]|uniref:Peroxisomal membrane protein PEX14 n=1 Tax=Trichodelitschia bisporula TaxID=703511 RepID=A0A6G1HRD8_9PEZI|nr:hypothetical protein EJ06DRAFT_583701 [Trichodelitschia bisporula]
MVREDLISSAVSFLQDPSVAAAPLDKRIAFLQSKNLTQDEVDVALARAAGQPGPVAQAPSPQQQQYAYAGPPQPQNGYPVPPGYWPAQQPPAVPKRDWRDWFIMATVMGGVGYGLYFTAKRYIVPLIAPPTPPQLEQDKAAIDAAFDKTFALLDQLTTDTEALKAAEVARTTRLDAALSELESVVTTLKEADRKREDDARRSMDEIRSLRDLIPKALDAQKESTDERLKGLGSELKSLKTLVSNRVQPAAAPVHRATPSLNGGVPAASAPVSPAPTPTVETPAVVPASTPAVTPAASTAPAPGSAAAGLLNRRPGGRAAIPAWQMAAAAKSTDSVVSVNGESKEEGGEVKAP